MEKAEVTWGSSQQLLQTLYLHKVNKLCILAELAVTAMLFLKWITTLVYVYKIIKGSNVNADLN